MLLNSACPTSQTRLVCLVGQALFCSTVPLSGRYRFAKKVNVLNHVSLRSVPHHEKTYCCRPRMQLPRHEEFEGCLSKKLLSHLRHKGKQELKLCLNPASVNSIKLSLPPNTKVMNERMATKKCCSLHNLYGDWCREYACGGRGYSK